MPSLPATQAPLLRLKAAALPGLVGNVNDWWNHRLSASFFVPPSGFDGWCFLLIALCVFSLILVTIMFFPSSHSSLVFLLLPFLPRVRPSFEVVRFWFYFVCASTLCNPVLLVCPTLLFRSSFSFFLSFFLSISSESGENTNVEPERRAVDEVANEDGTKWDMQRQRYWQEVARA